MKFARILTLIAMMAAMVAATAQNDVEDVVAVGDAVFAIKFVARDTELRDNGVLAVHGLYVTKTEVTQAQWRAMMHYNPSATVCDTMPVTNVEPDSAMEFCRRIDATLVFGVRLLCEEEWRYAASGGLYPEHYRYAGSNNVGFVAWYKANSRKKPHPVAMRVPNELGLFDMSGNVGELVTAGDKPVSPRSKDRPEYKVMGGSYADPPEDCTTASAKPYQAPDSRTGLRICWPITLYY